MEGEVRVKRVRMVTLPTLELVGMEHYGQLIHNIMEQEEEEVLIHIQMPLRVVVLVVEVGVEQLRHPSSEQMDPFMVRVEEEVVGMEMVGAVIRVSLSLHG